MPPVPRRRSRTGSSVSGSTPLLLPRVSTLPATQITNTSAYLNGAVNPEGLATSWWFEWGTTPQYGSSSTPTSLGAGTIPLTVGMALTGLTQGITYHFAVVAQSAAGTVPGTDMAFVAQTAPIVPVATTPLDQFGAPVTLPHFAYPFVITTQGAEVVDQDSLEEVFACVQAIVACQRGACPELPDFGIPDPTFLQAPLDPTGVLDAISTLEPRAEEETVVDMLDDGTTGNWSIAMDTSSGGTEGT